MSTCRIFSDRSRSAFRGGRVVSILLLLGTWASLTRGAVSAQDLLTQDEALALAFPGSTSIERRTAFLDDADLRAVRQKAGSGVEVTNVVVTYYVGMSRGRPLGVAYFDAHRVRTFPEVVMVVVTPGATVDRIEILSFAEPPEYRAPQDWLRQFQGKGSTEDLAARRGIRYMTGATLTSRAITNAVRRTLALHEVIAPVPRPVPAGSR